MQDRYKVCWVTNMPAPYRLPIFDEIAKTVSLEIIFTLGENNWRGWQISGEKLWKRKFLDLKFALLNDFEFIPGLINPFKVIGKPDLIILGSWETPLYFLILIYGRFRKIPVFAIYESHEKSQKFKKGPINLLRKIFFQHCSRIISFGFLSDKVLIKMGIDDSRIISLFNAVDGYQFNKYALENRTENKNGHRFLYVGQLISRKNVMNLVLAFELVCDDGDTLEIVGDGEQLPKLIDLISKFNSKNSIILTGYVKPELMKSIYSRNDTLILPSTREVWGLVVNEALASGLNVVVSKDCGVSNLVKGMSGVYICNETVESIFQEMLASRREFSGFNKLPEILRYSTSNLGNAITDQIISYLSEHKN